MEEELHKRDQVGVQDFVLLEDYRNPKAFVENLRRRFKERLIYTYIGTVLVSVNPYQELPIYNDDVIKSYRNVNFYELPPHIFAITDEAYRMMRQENQDQCMLISGESGAGKTEATKKVLQYIATTSVHSKEVEKVKSRLLLSNPILEAFGNAKTNRNDNSSRFGKYMDVQFNFKGMPVGGHILNYLLEKSRVVHHAIGERNFHIFYQILHGNPSLMSVLHLNGSADQFFYLKQGHSIDVDSIDDAHNFKVIQDALNVCDFSLQEQQALFEVVASVLHLGNMVFVADGDITKIKQPNEVQYIAELLGCPAEKLMSSLHTKSIETKGERLSTPLTVDQSVYARDALAKGVYDRMFTWIVKKINSSLESKVMHRGNVIGLLDIYGFEIFESNKFEQFCINYCNEKLQQLFIELTLKSEQEEYLREGIEWEPVEYFNNKVICDLVEGKPLGIISVMDEECLRPGDVTDATLLSNLISMVGKHPHFVSHQTADVATRKTLTREDFRLKHYAGEVTYNINGFLDKNNDLLFRDLKETMVQTTNVITAQCFPAEELISKKRPDTAGTQFRASLAQLMDILMIKEPSYVRCIKPNDFKKADLFDERIVNHQVQYLGLMENLRVRRAGFAYRRPYGIFLQRYKSLCPATWPTYHGSARDGVELLVKHLKYGSDEYKLGKSKLFIRQPQTLFRTEDSFQIRKHELATKIQARYKAFFLQRRFLIMKASSLTVQCQWRRYVAKKLLERRRNAAHAIRRFVKGYKHRMEPLCEENSMFIQFMKHNFLTELIKKLPKTVLEKTWPSAPPLLTLTSDMLQALCMKNMVLKYVKSLPAARKVQFEQKVVAEGLFKNKKESYPFSVKDFFVDSRLAAHHETLKKNVFDVNIKAPEEKVLYSLPVTKYDRHGYKPRHRVMILTDKTLYVLNEKDFKIKDKLNFAQLKGMSLSALTDGFFLIDVDLESDNGSKGDVILQSEYAIEAVTKIVMATGMKDHVDIAQSGLTSHGMNSGKQGSIEFYRGETYGLKKSKSGHLLVTTPPIQ